VEDEDTQHSIAYCIYLFTWMENYVRQSLHRQKLDIKTWQVAANSKSNYLVA